MASPLTARQLSSQLSQAMKWAWEATPSTVVLLCISQLVMALLPAAMAWVGRLIIDGVMKAASTHTDEDRRFALIAMAIEFGLALLLLAGRRAQTYLRSLLRSKLGNLLNRRILERAQLLEFAQFEEAKTYDLLLNAQRDAPTRPNSLVHASLMLIRSAITLLTLGALLWDIAWWSVIPLVLCAIPEFIIETKLSGQAFALSTGRAPDSRRLAYLETALTRDTHVKEVKLYGLAPLLLGRHRALYERFLKEDLALARRQFWLMTIFTGLSSLSFYACYAAVGWRAASGLITIGALTLTISAFRQGQGALEDVLSSVAGMYDDALYVSNLSSFFEIPVHARTQRQLPARALPPSRFSIELEKVSFRYPGKETWALHDLSFTIAPGEKLALVGENGAGKSTLIKLLLRLYEPTEGVIRFGGIDVRELDTETLHARLGAVFQDFVRYQLSANENIALGDVTRADQPEVIEKAARDGGADEVIDELAKRGDTMLGTWFEGGQDLSGGQWQKLAIARSFMRLSGGAGAGADLLILDEPTAAIDAQAEFELFERFQKLTEGRTAIIISHRFSTVRLADRIAVLEHGKMIELGSHDALLAADGQYAHLFKLQARGYQ